MLNNLNLKILMFIINNIIFYDIILLWKYNYLLLNHMNTIAPNERDIFIKQKTSIYNQSITINIRLI